MDGVDIEISGAEVWARLQAGEELRLLDVRELWEFEQAHLEGAEHIPVMQIPLFLEKLAESPESEYICYCHSGLRSLTAASWMRQAGLPRARSMAGGIDQWSREIDPSVPRY